MLSTLFRRTSLSTKVGLLSLGLCFISVLVLAKYAQEKLTADLTRTTSAQLASAAAYAAQDVSLDLAVQLKAIESSARLIVADDISGSLRDHSQAMQALFDTGFVAVMANGAVTYPPSPNPASEGLAWAELDSVRAALSGVGSPIGLVDIASGPNRKAIVFAAAIRDSDHRIVGALVGLSSSTASHVFNPLLQKAYGQAGVFVILDQARGLLGERSAAQSRLSIAQPALMDRRTLWPSCGGHPTEIGSGLSATLVAGATVQSTNWCVVVALPLGEILGQYQALSPGAYWRAFYLSLPFGLLTFWAMRRVLAPLSQAIAGLDAIDITDPQLTGLPDTGVGEVHTLLSSVNTLLRTLKQREQALWESQALFRSFADTSPVLIVQTRSSSPLGEEPLKERTEYINPAFTAILGYTIEDVPTTGDVYARMFPDPAEYRTMAAAWQARGNAVLEGHSFEPLSAWCTAKDGSRKFLSWQRVVSPGDQHWAFGLDLTSSQLANESLNLFRRAVEQSPGMIEITDRHSNLVYVNPRLEEATGYSREELLGQNARIFSGGTMPRDTAEAMYEELQAGRDFRCELKNRKKDGTLHEVSISVSSIFDDQGTLINFIGIKEDITERNRTAALLIDAGLSAERASRAKSAFVSNVSHELRTPMNAVVGFAQLLETDDTLSPQQREYVSQITAGGQHVVALVNDVLDLSTIEAGELRVTAEPFDIGAVIAECEALIQPLADDRGLTLRTSCAPDTYAVGDRLRVKQVVLNLMSNAVKFSLPNSDVTVDAAQIGSDRVRITVSDTGEGIAAEDVHEVFKAFSRLHAKHKHVEGTGIGLTISRQLVELMGGTLTLSSQVGVGSQFRVELASAAALPVAAASVTAEPTSPAASTRRHRVLCIDDSPTNQALIKGIFKLRPQIVLVRAVTGAEGIASARAERPDLMLIDINLPDMTGHEVLHTCRADELLCTVPAIAVSADALASNVAHGLEMGFDAYLTKPLDLQRFLAVIDSYLSDRPQSDQPQADEPTQF